MRLIDNINTLLGEDFKHTLKPGSKLKIAASCFSIYAYVALKKELESLDSLEFVFTSPTFVPNEVSDKMKKEQREFHIPKTERERSLIGSEFEIQLKNQLTQKAIARECADWIRRKATFRPNRGQAPMQPFAGVQAQSGNALYMPLQGFTAVDLGYQKGNALSNIVTCFDEPAHTGMFLSLFEQIWNDPDKLDDVTARLCEHIDSVYRENSPEHIYFLMLYNILKEFLEDLNEDVLPNDRTGYQDSLIWQKLFNFQRDAATGLINKLETYNGCILADSVGLGKTFTALAVIKYYELRNKSVLVLCPKKLADNWLNYNRSRLLIQKTDLALDRVQKKLPLDDGMVKHLRQSGLIEGRKPNFHVSATVAEATASKAEYIRTRGFDDAHYKKMILELVEKFGSASRHEIDQLLAGKLSDALDEEQKQNKISNPLRQTSCRLYENRFSI